MTLIEINAGNNSFHSLIKRRVLEDDVGRLSAQLESQFFPCPGNGTRERFADAR